MAETVKKSRIVSDSDDNLEESLMEEFNLRLKNCMSQDDIKGEGSEDLYENIEVVKTNGQPPNGAETKEDTTRTSPVSNPSYEFIQVERDSYYDQPNGIKLNGHGEGGGDESNHEDINKDTNNHQDTYETINTHQTKTDFYENNVSNIKVVDQIVDTSDYEPVEPKLSIPNLTFQTPLELSNEGDNLESKSVKDRMFLSSDDTSCLLFTQTVTSPMLTPSEENIDFLKGFRRESTSTQNTSSDNTKSDSNEDKVLDVNEATENEVGVDLSPPSEPDNEENPPKILEESETTPQTTEDDTTPIAPPQNGQGTNGIDTQVEEIFEGKVLENFEKTTTNTDEVIYENTEFLTNPKEQIYENLKGANRDNSPIENVYENIEDLRRQMEEIEKTPNRDDKIETANEEDVCVEFVENPSESAENAPFDEKSVENVPFYDASVENVENAPNESVEKVENADASVEKLPIDDESVENVPNAFNESVENVENADVSVENIQTTIQNGAIESPHENSSHKPPPQPEVSPSQLVETIKSQLLKSPNEPTKDPKEAELQELQSLKTLNLMKHINKFEHIETETTTSSQISESTYVETSTVVETKSDCIQDKSLKKKKSKKSRSHEKENISVSETNISGDDENYYNVNVKSLCRSFGDLTKIGDEKCRRENTKSSFSKFDALQKKNVLHVRSSDSTKAQEKFNGSQIDNTNCKSCSKPVFQMEQIKAEKAIWHKNCFRCHECNKQLNVDTYESNEGLLYCKAHFKSLFAPKVVEDDTPTKPKKHELIIRENQPKELPPDVVRASDKPDLGLEELHSLNVKERFHVFEHHEETNELERTPSQVNVKRSPSILSKLARFQAKGMDIGVSDEALNGIPIEESTSEEDQDEEEETIEGEDADLIRAKRAQKEKPFHFVGMSDVKSKWEQGDQHKDERREERKQEIQTIRNRLFMGKQGKMKEAYQQAVMESEMGTNVKKSTPIEACDTRSLKERFEKGEVYGEDTNKESKDQEDMAVFESAISKKSRSIFQELDANASKPPRISPVNPLKLLDVKKARDVFLQHQTSEDVVKSSEQIDDVTVQTADIQQRFKFFETYKEPEKQRKEFRITPPRDGQVKAQTPEREVYRDPEIVRAEEYIEDSVVAKESHTATKMLNKFRQMEEDMTKEHVPAGPKPLKRFTPPPEPVRQETSSGEEESGSGEESEEEIDGGVPKVQDEDLIEAQKAARAKQLRAKFEKWEANEIRREQNNSSVNIAEEIGEDSQIESTKTLRARFESMRESKNDTNRSARVKVNRFVEFPTNTDTCEGCGSKVYPLEKISVHGHIYHKGCFKCMECSTVLRMDSYSYNQGLLYCMPHFKRLFISKGNYDSAFGLKEKWNTSVA